MKISVAAGSQINTREIDNMCLNNLKFVIYYVPKTPKYCNWNKKFFFSIFSGILLEFSLGRLLKIKPVCLINLRKLEVFKKIEQILENFLVKKSEKFLVEFNKMQKTFEISGSNRVRTRIYVAQTSSIAITTTKKKPGETSLNWSDKLLEGKSTKESANEREKWATNFRLVLSKLHSACPEEHFGIFVSEKNN